MRKLQSFLGFVNFYKDTINKHTALKSPFYNPTTARKYKETVHNLAEHVKCFNKIKRSICAAPRLANPNLDAPFTLYTDAVDAVLHQRNANGVNRVI